MTWWARPGWVALAAGTALTAAAAALPGTVDVGAGSSSAGPSPTEEAVRAAALACPGPETEGVTGVPAVPGAETTVLASSAPAEALEGLTTTTAQPGRLAVRPLPAGATEATTARGSVVTAALVGASHAEVSATGPLAAGLAALQTSLRRDGDERGLQALPCTAPTTSAYLLGGGGGSTRRERLVVANPGGNPVTVEVAVHGGKGVAAQAGPRLTVPAEGRVGLLLDSLALDEPTPAVRVVATGGAVTAVLEDSWIEGAVGRGRDDSAAGADPATEQVVPVAALDGPARLRVLVPGDAPAVVRGRLLTTQGPVPLPGDGAVRVPGGAVRDLDLDLAAVPAGAYAVQVSADQPVVAAVVAERRPTAAGPSELGWASATAPLAAVAGSPLPPGLSATVVLAATGAPGAATVLTVDGDGAVSERPVSLAADSVVAVELGKARSVWVRRTTGTLRAGLALRGGGPGDPLLSVVGLPPAAVGATSGKARAVPR